MNESTVVIEEVTLKEGTASSGKPWKRVLVKDGNGNFYSTFETSLYERAKELTGHRAVIQFEQEGKFQNLQSIRPAEKLPEEKLGTGEYVKGQMAGTDARRILVCSAWDRATELAALDMRVNTNRDWTPALILESAQHFFEHVFASMARKSNLLTDDDIPFDRRP